MVGYFNLHDLQRHFTRTVLFNEGFGSIELTVFLFCLFFCFFFHRLLDNFLTKLGSFLVAVEMYSSPGAFRLLPPRAVQMRPPRFEIYNADMQKWPLSFKTVASRRASETSPSTNFLLSGIVQAKNTIWFSSLFRLLSEEKKKKEEPSDLNCSINKMFWSFFLFFFWWGLIKHPRHPHLTSCTD